MGKSHEGFRDTAIAEPAYSACTQQGKCELVAQVAGSHAIYVSKPEAVAALIAKAAKSLSSEIAA